VALGVAAPGVLLNYLLGIGNPDVPTRLMARHWSLLVALVGGLLIAAAFHPELREAAMIVASAEKLALGIMVLASPLRTRAFTLFAVGADAVMVLLFAWVAFS
jgi:hypothetical protein